MEEGISLSGWGIKNRSSMHTHLVSIYFVLVPIVWDERLSWWGFENPTCVSRQLYISQSLAHARTHCVQLHIELLEPRHCIPTSNTPESFGAQVTQSTDTSVPYYLLSRIRTCIKSCLKCNHRSVCVECPIIIVQCRHSCYYIFSEKTWSRYMHRIVFQNTWFFI